MIGCALYPVSWQILNMFFAPSPHWLRLDEGWGWCCHFHNGLLLFVESEEGMSWWPAKPAVCRIPGCLNLRLAWVSHSQSGAALFAFLSLTLLNFLAVSSAEGGCDFECVESFQYILIPAMSGKQTKALKHTCKVIVTLIRLPMFMKQQLHNDE